MAKMTIATAKEVLSAAIEQEIFEESDMPDEKAEIISAAEDVVEQAQEAYDGNVRGEEVMTVLRMAGALKDEEEESEEEEEETEEEEEEEPEAEEEPEEEEEEEESGSEELDEPWDGYDEAKVSVIKAAADEGEWDPDQLEYVLDYERANKNRDVLVKYLAGALGSSAEEPEEEPEEEEEEGEEPESFDPEEHIPGYDRKQSKTVIKALEDIDDEDVLRGISQYEDERKGREPVLQFISEKLGETQPEEPEDEPEDEPEEKPVKQSKSRQAGRGVKQAHDARDRALAAARKAGLPEPEKPDAELTFPVKDISKLTHEQLQELHWGALSAFSYSNWVAAEIEAELTALDKIRQRAYDEAYRDLKKSDDKPSDKLAESEARLNDDVEQADERIAELKTNLRPVFKLREVYKETLDSISRQFTMREHEAEQSKAPARRTSPPARRSKKSDDE